VRHEWLDQNIFETIEEAQGQENECLLDLQQRQTLYAIGGITPAMKLKMAV
jgi:putative transposase